MYNTSKNIKDIEISRTNDGRIKVSLPYNPSFIAKIKTISGHRWHPEEKHWSFPDTGGILEKILKVFEGEEMDIDTSFQTELSITAIAKSETIKLFQIEDLRKELVSRKYSYKIVKSHIYYNRKLVSFTGKEPSDINENDIKNYLLHLAEEKQSETSTINQAINALKFYYGTMLKKKFIYEVKRPRKDKKLPVVLSKEEVAKILSSNR